MSSTTECIVYREAVRLIARQETDLDELRARTGILLAAASVATTFLGATSLDATGFGAFAWLAVLAFVAVGALTIAILLPRGPWIFGLSPRVLIEDHIEVEARNSPEKLYRFLAETLEGHYEKNQQKLDTLYRYFEWACLSLVVEVVAWLIQLGWR